MKELFKKFANLLRPVLIKLVMDVINDLASKPAQHGAAYSPKSVKTACNKAFDDFLNS